jgi:hypothetical protein
VPVSLSPNAGPVAQGAQGQGVVVGASQPPAGATSPPPTPSGGAGVGGFGGVVGGFAPVAVASAAPKPAARPVWRPAPVRAAPKPAANTDRAADDDAKDKETAKKEPPTKNKKDTADDETKKALEALQKAQLESASSFGN